MSQDALTGLLEDIEGASSALRDDLDKGHLQSDSNEIALWQSQVLEDAKKLWSTMKSLRECYGDQDIQHFAHPENNYSGPARL